MCGCVTDIRNKFITPAMAGDAGWDLHTQLRKEVFFTRGRVIVRGKMVSDKGFVRHEEKIGRNAKRVLR